MQFGSVALATHYRTEERTGVPQAGSPLGVVDATGSPAKSPNLGGVVDFRFLTITGLDPVATTTPAGLPGWGPRFAPRFCS